MRTIASLTNKLQNLREATHYFTEKYGGSLIDTIEMENSALCHVILREGPKYYITFKRKWFISFGEKFLGRHELGCGLDADLMERAYKDKAIIVFIFDTRAEYRSHSKDYRAFVKANNTYHYLATGDKAQKATVPESLLVRMK